MISSNNTPKELMKVFVNSPELIIFTDIEANGLGKHTFPIEIGWANLNMDASSFLIKPHPDWSKDLWDHEAEKVHKITWEQLMDEGIPPLDAAERVVEAFKDKIIVSDAPYWEAKWFSILFDKVGVNADFVGSGQSEDEVFTSIISDNDCFDAAMCFFENEDVLVALDKIEGCVEKADKFFPATHRAADDALNLVAKFKAVFHPEWDFKLKSP